MSAMVEMMLITGSVRMTQQLVLECTNILPIATFLCCYILPNWSETFTNSYWNSYKGFLTFCLSDCLLYTLVAVNESELGVQSAKLTFLPVSAVHPIAPVLPKP